MSKRAEVPFAVTLKVRDTCLCLHMQRAARAVARRYDEALRPANMTNWQFSLLMSLNGPMPPSIARIAAVLGMDRTTITANLKPLERRGLVTVTIADADRRGRVVTLTPAGRALLAAAFPLWKRAQAAVERLVAGSGAGADHLRTDLRALS